MSKLNRTLYRTGITGLFLLVCLIGCTSTRIPDMPRGDEPLEDIAAPAEKETRTSTMISYYRDDTDAGDAPFVAGCHWRYPDRECTHDKTFFDGDGCYNERDLWEWTERKCHRRLDRKRYDCNRECQKRGFKSGACVWKPKVCAGNRSAQCECTPDVEP